MAYESTAFTESQDFFQDDSFDSQCSIYVTFTAQSVTGTRPGTGQLNGFRITFSANIQRDTPVDTGCVWEDASTIDVTFYGPNLNTFGETLTLPITLGVAEVDLSAEAAKFQFITQFNFSFFKEGALGGNFVTDVEVDPATAVADPFWTNYRNTLEVC